MKIKTKLSYTKSFSKEFNFPYSDNHIKKYHYSCESYFQESYTDFKLENIDLNNTKKNISYIILKPDFFVSDKLALLEDVIEQLPCKVIGVFEIQFSRYSIRELWRYEYNNSKIDRYSLIDKLLTTGPSIFLLLKKEIKDDINDFSHQMTMLKKNNKDKNLLNGKSIREYLNTYTGTFNFIHSPDEFIDFIREIGVLFEKTQRIQICNAIKKDTKLNYLENLKKVERLYPKLALDKVNINILGISSKDLQRWNHIIYLNNNINFKNKHIPRRFDFEEPYHES